MNFGKCTVFFVLVVTIEHFYYRHEDTKNSRLEKLVTF